jgi:hypothetical protein
MNPRQLTDQLTSFQNFYEIKKFHETDADYQWAAGFFLLVKYEKKNFFWGGERGVWLRY